MLSRIIKDINSYILYPFKQWGYSTRSYNHFKKLLKTAKTDDILDKTYVFNIVRNFRRSIDPEIFFGILFALNGAKIKILLDDGILKHWDTVQIDNLPKIQNISKYNFNPYRFINVYERIFSKEFLQNWVLKLIRKKAIKTYKTKNLEFIYYSQILKNKKVNYENWHELEKFAESSTIRFFKTCDLNYNNKYVKYFYKLSLQNAILTYNVGEYVLNKIKPDSYFSTVGIYSTYGPPYELMIKNNIPSYLYSGIFLHSKTPSMIYYTDTKPHTLSRSKLWKDYKNTPVTKEMENKVKQFFDDRTKGSVLDLSLYFKEKRNIFKVNKEDGFKYHIAIFPHVIWDGNIRDRHTAFDGYIDWMISTINFVKNRKDIKLFVKAHPAEMILCKKTNGVIDILKRHIKFEDFNNIVLIPPEMKVDTYAFLKSGIDLAMVYDNFLGIEIPYLKIPTLTCVNGGFSSIKEGNFTIMSREEYLQILDNIGKIVEDYQQNFKNKYYKNIIRYVYWYIYENKFKLPIISYKNGNVIYDLNVLQQKDFLLDKKLINFFTKKTG